MPELSPQAQAILDAYNAGFARPVAVHHKPRIAAALRAAVKQVMPEVVNAVGDEHDDARRDQWIRIQCRFLGIAAELETQ